MQTIDSLIKNLLLEADSCSDFFKLLYKSKKLQSTKMTIRGFSKKFNFENPSLISDILKDKKKVSKNLLDQIIKTEKLSYTEERYLENLFHIENLKKETAASDENKIIQSYWRIEKKSENSVSSIALILSTAIDFFSGSLCKSEIYDKMGFFISKTEINDALDELIHCKYLEIKNDRYSIVKSSLVLLNSSVVDLIKIQKIIDRICSFSNKKNKATAMTFYISKNEYSQVKGEIDKSLEKIALIAEKASQDKDISQDRRLSFLYTFLGSLEPDDSWLL